MYYTTTAEQGGAGIGLYMVKTNLEILDAEIEVINNPKFEHGAAFSLSIPFKK